jgi:hypothetical protein
VVPNPRKRKLASPGEAGPKRVQLAPNRRRSSLEQAEVAVNPVRVAPKSRKNKYPGKAAEAAQNHSAVCTYRRFSPKRFSESIDQETPYDESRHLTAIHPLSGSNFSQMKL